MKTRGPGRQQNALFTRSAEPAPAVRSGWLAALACLLSGPMLAAPRVAQANAFRCAAKRCKTNTGAVIRSARRGRPAEGAAQRRTESAARRQQRNAPWRREAKSTTRNAARRQRSDQAERRETSNSGGSGGIMEEPMEQRT